MEIREACEHIKSNGGFYGSLRLGTKANEAYNTIEKALCDGYTLCKVDEAIEKMDNAKPPERIMDYEDNIVSGFNYGIDAARNILQEACL